MWRPSPCCGAALGCSPCSTVAAGLCPTPRPVPHTSSCAPHLILCPTPHPVPHISSCAPHLILCPTPFCAPHLVLCPTPRSVPHTSFCAPHLILCPTPRPVPHASFRARAAPGAAGEHGAAPGRQREDLLPADGGGDSGSSRWVSAFGGVREARVLLVRAAASPPSPGGGAGGAGRTRRAASERRSPPGAPQTRGWSARCARRTTRWPSRCGSCRATTSSTAAASCPGWSW